MNRANFLKSVLALLGLSTLVKAGTTSAEPKPQAILSGMGTVKGISASLLPKWEYREYLFWEQYPGTAYTECRQVVGEDFAKLGAEGWELVSSHSHGSGMFKRRLPS